LLKQLSRRESLLAPLLFKEEIFISSPPFQGGDGGWLFKESGWNFGGVSKRLISNFYRENNHPNPSLKRRGFRFCFFEKEGL